MNENVYNIDDRRRTTHDRPLDGTLHEALREFRDFVETRVAMLQSEMRENLANLKFAAPLLVAGVLFGATAWLLLTGALVAVLTVAWHGSAYAPFIALVIVGVAYAAIALCALFMARGRMSKKGLLPERTLNVLKEDKVWLENEVRTQL